MRTNKKNYLLFITADIFIVIFSVFGIQSIYNKADIPLKFYSINSNLIVKENTSPEVVIPEGDTIISINQYNFSSQEEIEVYLDRFKPNSYVQINYLKNGNLFSKSIRLIRFYSNFYVITVCITGLLFILIGLFVLSRKPDNMPAKLFNMVNTGVAAIIMMTWGNYHIPPWFSDYILRIIFSLAYSFAPALFVHFTLSFPKEKLVPKYLLILLYASAFIISAFSLIYFFKTIQNVSVLSIKQYLFVFNLSRAYLVLCILMGMFNFLHSYKTADNLSEKKKLRWILTGFILGPGLFICLWVIPQALTNYGLVPEELVVIFMLFIPLTFAIAILKHHLFDIDLIIERSAVYIISISLLIATYALIIATIMYFAKNINEFLSSGAAAVITAALFQPAKTKIQKIIDRKFFHVRYDFRIASRKFLDEIKNCSNIQSLGERIVEQIKILIPVEKQGFFIFNNSNSRIYLQADENFDILRNRGIFLDIEKMKTDLPKPVALVNKVEPGCPIEEADFKVFKRWGIALAFPIKSNSDKLLGFLVLGQKKSGSRFTIEDIDLLIEVGFQAGLTIERIQIQESLIREQLLREKLKELNELKTFFISSVSHELKTPLTSIRMFSEFLHKNENLDGEKKEEYLEIIEGECDRLGRLIENILDLSKIERGVKEYHFEEVDIKSLLEHSIKLMTYQLKMEKCKIVTELCEEECEVYGDPDLLQSAILNLLSNGIKYSAKPKAVYINMECKKDSLKINFKNHGSCLPYDELLKITKPYYRSGNVKNQKIPGSGIGLALVSEIMAAHKGQLLISNVPDSGCIFSLSFPSEKYYEKDINSRGRSSNFKRPYLKP